MNKNFQYIITDVKLILKTLEDLMENLSNRRLVTASELASCMRNWQDILRLKGYYCATTTGAKALG